MGHVSTIFSRQTRKECLAGSHIGKLESILGVVDIQALRIHLATCLCKGERRAHWLGRSDIIACWVKYFSRWEGRHEDIAPEFIGKVYQITIFTPLLCCGASVSSYWRRHDVSKARDLDSIWTKDS